MACNESRLNCTPAEIFAATAIPACGKLVNPENLQAEQLIYDQSYNDLINNFGIGVQYYVNPFNLSAANLLYGEEPTKVFRGPMDIQMYIELDENSITLSKFGFDAADDFTGYVHIDTFTTAASALFDYSSVGQDIEPKSGDLIVMQSLSCDRPNGRGPKIYEITERRDDDISSINPMLGHYVYRLRAKRYEYSFEPNAPIEPVNDQVYENSFSGVLSTNIPGDSVSENKSYTWDINGESRENIYDMDNNDTDIYGGYY
mgnify:CR=1 FL=1|tara:strand:- start:262 stop:1038 length:777 start_codon:yes stop_codon:yes gene_type:complete